MATKDGWSAQSQEQPGPAEPEVGEQQTPSWAFHVPLVGLEKGRCTLRQQENKISQYFQYFSTLMLMVACTALAAEPNSGLPRVRNKLILSLLICQIAYQVWEPLKVRITVRGDGDYPGDHVPFVPTLAQMGQRVILVTVTPDLCSTDPSVCSC